MARFYSDDWDVVMNFVTPSEASDRPTRRQIDSLPGFSEAFVPFLKKIHVRSLLLP